MGVIVVETVEASAIVVANASVVEIVEARVIVVTNASVSNHFNVMLCAPCVPRQACRALNKTSTNSSVFYR